MDRAHHLRAGDVSQIGRDRGTSASVYAQDDAARGYEQELGTSGCTPGNTEIKDAAQHEKYGVCQTPPQHVGDGGPEKSPANIEQTQQCREARSHASNGSQLRFVQFNKLQGHADGRAHADDADAGAHIHAQHHPEQPELGDSPDFADMHMVLGDHGVVDLGWFGCPALWFPAWFGDTIAKGACHHEHEIDQRHHDKGLYHTDIRRSGKVFHQVGSQRRANHCPATKPHDGHAGSHAPAVGKPLDQCRYWRDIAQTESNSTNHARTQNNDKEWVKIQSEGGEKNAATPAEGSHHAYFAWSNRFEPPAPERSGRSQQNKKQDVHPTQGGDFPLAGRSEKLRQNILFITCVRVFDSKRLGQWQPKHRKAIGHAYAQVDGQGRRGDQPTVEARTCHDVFFVKKAGSFLGEGLLPHHARCHAVSWMQSTYKLGAVSLISWW